MARRASLLGPNGFEEQLFNEIIEPSGEWDGETTVNVGEDGEYTVQVDAPQESWTVLIEPI